MSKKTEQPKSERRERQARNGIARVYDFTSPSKVVLVGEAVNFFGTKAEQTTYKKLSKQWLTEITVIAADGAGADQEAIEIAAGESDDPDFSLEQEYSCSAVGANLRILKSGLADAKTLYSYMIVDESDPGSEQPIEVREIWIAECIDPNKSILLPEYAKGKRLRSPDRRTEYVQWEAIQYRIENNL